MGAISPSVNDWREQKWILIKGKQLYSSNEQAYSQSKRGQVKNLPDPLRIRDCHLKAKDTIIAKSRNSLLNAL